MSEVAGQGINTVKGLRANGFDAVMAVWTRNKMADAPDIDLHINRSNKLLLPLYAIKMAWFALDSMRRYDVMHSHFGYSLFPLGLDLFFHKFFGLKCFAEFHGTDIRHIYNPDICYQFYKEPVPSEEYRRRAIKQRNRLLNKVQGIIIHDHELAAHIPDCNKPVYIVPLRVQIDKITPAYPAAETEHTPIIVHAPSKRSTKGTEGILEKLKSVKGDFELILVENMSHDEAMQIYSKADIIIDQIALGTYGVFSIEAMAMGKPVITYISQEMKEHFPEDLPIISTDFDELPEVIDKLIADPKLRHDIGVRGRKYAERYHDHNKVTKYLYDIYNGTINENNLFKLL